MNNFEGFGLCDALNKSLRKMNYETPTPIQAKAIPLAMRGRDVLGSAQTGTGKTAAFSIPMVEALMRSPDGSALVLTPTRELAKQVLDVVHQLLGYRSSINTAFIIGGEPMGKQLKQLRANPRVIVGTPGRINDHLDRGTLKLHDTSFLVLDETDRMLDMGFGVQLDRIAEHLPEDRQTLMFSATLPKEIVRISNKYLTNPERVSVGETNVIAQNIEQEMIRIEQNDKYEELTLQLHDRDGSVIVFVKTKYGADRMAKNLRRDGFTSEALHGDLKQNKRDRVMKNFRSQNFRVLIATDIAARGLDVPHIEHVINYDLPQVAEDYIHRMGRTARAGAQGSAISFVSAQDGRKWHAIERLLNPEAANDKGSKPNGRKKKNSKYRHKNKSRADRFSEDKAWADKPRADKSRGDKAWADKPRTDKSRGDKAWADKPRTDKSRGDKAWADKPRTDKSRGDKAWADKPRTDKSRGDKAWADKPRTDKSRGDKAWADKPRTDKSRGDKAWADKPRTDKSRGDKAWADKPRTDKSRGDKAWADKPRTDKSRGDKAWADKPRADKSRGDKAWADKPRADKSRGDKAWADKPRTDKSRGDKAWADKPRTKKTWAKKRPNRTGNQEGFSAGKSSDRSSSRKTGSSRAAG